MKKNLKKVISAVIALALSASTFASVSFAKSFTDVASTASYAEAVDVLSSLGIINGYEDGTFGPDKTITRAEAAKMIVAMVNKIATAEGRKGATQFDDVAADHWAAGFINVGVSDKFINGKSATTFDPEGNVKYNEIVKMVVSCLGYEEYAQFYGGYPTGYVAIADAEGITKGCSMDGDAAATRGVVAQLIYNALNTPIIQSKGMQYSAAQGGFVPNIEKQDGEESQYFKSLLTEKFDAYYVQGKVTETPKDGVLDFDTVKFLIDTKKVEAYDEELAEATTAIDVLIGETAAADYLNTYANAIIRINEDEEYEFISFVASGKNKSVALDLALVDDEKYTADEIKTALNADAPYIYVFASEDSARSSKYKLEPKFTLYVNGVKADTADYDKYIINNHVGVIELTDTYGSPDGYDIVSVEYYDTTRVTSTSAKNIYINKNAAGLNASSLPIDAEKLEEAEVVMNVYLNDEKINASEIKKDDILSIKYNVNKGSDSAFFDIYVSRDSAEGKFSGLDTEDKLITIAGEKYASVEWEVDEKGKYAGEFQTKKMGNEYKVFLDIFGRIYTQEELASTAKYAVILKWIPQQNSWDSHGLKLYFTDGTNKNVEFASSPKFEGKFNTGKVDKDTGEPILAEIKDLAGLRDQLNGSDTNPENIMHRVVRYTINTQNKISKIEFLNTTKEPKIAKFDEKNDKIGNIIMNDVTTVIDASEFVEFPKELTVASLDTLINDVEYTAYAYGNPSTTDDSYPFVLITDGQGTYTEDTTFAVVTKDIYPSIKDDGEEGQMLEVLYEGEEEVQALFVDEDAEYDNALAGDVVVLRKNADGDVKEIKVIFSAKELNDEGEPVSIFGNEDFTTFALTAFKKYISLPSDKWDTAWITEKDMETSLVFGPVVERNNRKFLAQIKDNKTKFDVEASKGATTSEGATLGIITTADTKVYVYDANAARADRFYTGTADDIMATQVSHFTKLDGDEYTIDWTITPVYNEEGKLTGYEGRAPEDQVNFAFAKLVDGVVTDIFVIVGIE